MSKYVAQDHFNLRARREGYRSRAAYKLAEMQRAQRLLRRGMRVVDLGCWPGGWLQVTAELVGPEGRVVGVDLSETAPLKNENVVALCGDFTHSALCERVLEELGGSPADWILSDAAPKLSGIRAADRANEEALLEAVEESLETLLRRGGGLLLKLLDGPEAQEIARRLKRRFGKARMLKPRATRRGSSERYLLARDFRG